MRQTSDKLLSELQSGHLWTDNTAAGNSTYPKGGVSCFADSFVGGVSKLGVMPEN